MRSPFSQSVHHLLSVIAAIILDESDLTSPAVAVLPVNSQPHYISKKVPGTPGPLIFQSFQ